MSESRTVHATTVAQGDRAVLIRGASGSGKSGLALQLLAAGARLVADDRTRIWRDGDTIWADAPDTIRGRIEARGVGLLRLPAGGPCRVTLVVDMDAEEDARLPERQSTELLGVTLRLLKKCDAAHFPAALTLYLRGGELE